MDSDSQGAASNEREQGASLGIVLTLVMMLAYFGFIGLGAFAPAILAQPIVTGGTVTVAFGYGLFVIALGVGLTSFYVWLTNRQSA